MRHISTLETLLLIHSERAKVSIVEASVLPVPLNAHADRIVMY